MSRYIRIVLIVLVIGLLLRACLNRDIPVTEYKLHQKSPSGMALNKFPGDYKTVEINGVEYRQARGKVGRYGGQFRTSDISEGPKTFNPWVSKDATSEAMGQLAFEGLTTTDAYDGRVIPQMAKSVSVDKTGKIYTVVLRKGLKWSDGKPITADDVVFTWNDIILAGLGNASMRDTVLVDGKPPKVEKVDNLTVRFTLPHVFAPFERQLSDSIAPKHAVEPAVKKGAMYFNSFWGVTTPPSEFVTSGMFRLSKYIPAQRVEFVRNPNYYMIDKANNKLPYLDKYIINIVGDLNNQLLKFEAGDIDILSVRGENVASFKQREPNSNYKMYNLGPDTGTMFVSLNMSRFKNSSGKYYVDPVKQKWFNDRNFRQAVTYAIDREAIVSNVLRGVGAPLFTAESLSSIFLNKKLAFGYPRNILKAKALLKQSGFTWDKQGNLYDNAGNRVEFNLFTNAGNTEREAVGVMLKQDLEELGIKVNFKPIEFNVLVGKLTDTLDWDAVIIALTGSQLEPNSGKNVWASDGSLHMFNQRKDKDLVKKTDLRPWEKELDIIFNKGAQQINFADRKITYDKYQEVVYRENPLIYLYSGLRVNAIRRKFGNVSPTPIGGITHNVEEFYILNNEEIASEEKKK